MDRDPEKLNLLRNAVEEVFGRKPGSPTDFDRLSYQIFTITGNKVGASTLKRFWGYVKSPYNATNTTLSVLSRFAGFRDWDSFWAQNKGEKDSHFSSSRLIIASDISLNACVKAEWESGKGLELVKIDQPNIFEVAESKNIKLLPGDIVAIDTMIIGERLTATDCRRNDVSLGTYVGARKTGIQRLSCQ